MKILHVNKFLWLSGGAERYMFDAAGEFALHFILPALASAGLVAFLAELPERP